MLPLPITPADALAHIVVPALKMLPAQMDTDRARVLLLAIAGQESNLAHRFQVVAGRPGVKGPARSLWQAELGGGYAGVLRHEATAEMARTVCELRGVQPTPMGVWTAIESDDELACVFARLLLWTDPKPLPDVGDITGAWMTYLRVWKPGKPHISRWKRHYDAAVEAVTA